MDSRRRSSGRSSVVESIKGGFTLAGVRISKEELRRRITMPEYLRLAVREAIQTKDDTDTVKRYFDMAYAPGADIPQPPEAPIVVFINSKSGGRHGPQLKARLQELMGEEQVFDLSVVKPHEFVQYGLSCLEKFAVLGDSCAKVTRERIRVVAAGGDGTVGWILGCLGELKKQGREPVPPTGIIPLGTGNDLSRSFGWGGSFPFNWKSATKSILDRVATGPINRLDSWNLLLSMPAGEKLETPHSLKLTEDASLDQELDIDGELPKKLSNYQGVYYNYFSIGMDAQVAYGFHHLRNEKPYLAQGPISNKISKTTTGFTVLGLLLMGNSNFSASLEIRNWDIKGLNNILRLYVKKVSSSKWEQVPVPSSVRSIVTLNLPSYGGGRNPWGHLKPDYLEKVSAIRFELRAGEWDEAYMQMDGEPWKQPINKEYSTFVEITRVPFQSLMVNGK
ncbi:hypothetical protein RND71_037539 [Anisodus tanguticus]|uniref:Diacylglycerol kinase n=1 Tax=Anisodus tanguticus TaxID=243964 RepID=A0AAE1R3A4_9SOLA|nr:hypothetical protein RND71_037539 [Anisodus tanguticus]